MLKHVQTVVGSTNTFPAHGNCHHHNSYHSPSKYEDLLLMATNKMDTISLNSTISSNDSSSLNDSAESTGSGSSSTATKDAPLTCSRTSWNASSYSLHSVDTTSSPLPPTPSSPKVVIKIYTRVLCTDVEYKTLSIHSHTTCKEIVQTILKKFRLQHRDSNLFYLTLEAWIKQTGIPIRSVMTLEDDACPALLQSCYRQKDLKFTLLMRRGENIKVYNKCPQGTSSSVNVLISDKTNVEELIKLVANILSLPESSNEYELYEYSPTCKIERKLSLTELPLAIKMDWPNQDFNVFQIRPMIINNITNASSNNNKKVITSILNTSIVDNFKKNLKSEFTLNLLSPSKTNSMGKVLYI